ncbi:MAG: rhodanese-like domain-containing protein [Deltaproteobacteria bacterium]|nr:rhodanese-like domain-containing protein [Deltaproteobacteria bacterium]
MQKHSARVFAPVLALALAVLLLVPALALADAKTGEPSGEPFKAFPNQVDIKFVKDLVDGKTIGLLVDARPKKKKFDLGFIPGAISLPFSAFEKMKGLLPADKNALVVFYCEGVKCALSHKSAFAAQKLGYTNLKVYPEGYPQWKKVYGGGASLAGATGAKSEAKKAEFQGSLKPGKEEGSIDLAQFQEIVNNKPESVMLIDVRDANEYATGSLKTARNLPTDKLEKELPTMKVDKPIIYVCGTGARSGEAYYMTREKRPDLVDVYYLDAELTMNKDGSYKISKPAAAKK